MELVLEQTQQGTSYEVSVSAEGVEELKIKVKIKGEKKEALLTLRQKPERFDTSAGNPVKEILLKLNLPDHRILKDGGEETKRMPRIIVKMLSNDALDVQLERPCKVVFELNQSTKVVVWMMKTTDMNSKMLDNKKLGAFRNKKETAPVVQAHNRMSFLYLLVCGAGHKDHLDQAFWENSGGSGGLC
ncbi:hypothetical protein Tco_0755560 [Tanacetum coccineum]